MALPIRKGHMDSQGKGNAMKLYKKSDLNLDASGLLVSKDGDIILPDINIVNQANELDTLIQQHEYLSMQPEATPMPSLDGFHRMSIKDNSRGWFEVKTPTLDAERDKAMAIMDEIDGQIKADTANQMLDKFAALIEFVDGDAVIDCGNELYCFDTPMLGNVLELTKEDVLDVIATIADFDGIHKVNDDDDKDENEDSQIPHVVVVPATEENLDKIEEFFGELLDSDDEDLSVSDDEDTTEE